jgi:serine/threonine protein kinase/Tfp pilus assembly protein PilF
MELTMSTILDPLLPTKDRNTEKTQRFSVQGILKPEAPPTEESLPLPTIAGYEIIDVLGRGGYGVVYKAIQVKVKRLVALKMILAGPHAGASELARFRTEAEAVGNLQHPNVVQIFEVGAQDGHSFFSLEYIDGGNLEEKLQSTPMTPRSVAQLVETLARAMHYAHSHGIIHRDLKPANVLLTTDGTPKITDFGLAKKLDNEQGFTRTGAAVGTPAYMAPEQAMGQTKTLGPAVDIYALGAILYQMLAGRVPFPGDSPVDVMIRVATEEPVPPSRLHSKLPRDLETICLKCLEKEPHRRYRTAQALADDLARFLSHEPILARPVNAWERSLKWMKRRKLVTALLAGIAFTSVGLLVSGAFYKESKQRHLNDSRLELRDLFDRAAKAEREGKWDQLEALAAAIDESALNLSLASSLKDEFSEAQEKLRKRLDGHRFYQNFMDSHDQAIFVGTRSPGEQSDEKIRTALKEAGNALALVGLSDSPTAHLSFAVPLADEEKNEIRKGSYELFLIMADLVARQKGKENQDQALHLLDQATRLGVHTKAFDQRRARYLKAAGLPHDAKDLAQSGESTDSALDHFLMGDDFYKQGQFREALAEFTKALQIQSNYFWARYYLSVCYLILGEPGPARVSLTECLNQKKLSTNVVWIYLMRGFAEGQLKDFEDAEKDFQAALKILESEKDDEALYVLYNNRGILRIGQPGEFSEGVRDLEEAINLNSKKYHAYLSLAQAYFQKTEPDAAVRKENEILALQLIDRAIKETKETTAKSLLYRERSRFQAKRNDYQAALGDLEQSIALESESSLTRAKAQIDRGRILQKLNRNVEALAAYDLALQSHSELVDAYRWRGEALFKLKRFPEALQAFDQYLEKGGKATAKVYQAQALVRGQLKDYAGAVEDYTRALALEKEPKEITSMLVNRGQAYLACQADQPALRDFDEALKHDPQNITAYLGRGFARVRKGDIPEGVKDAEKAIQVDGKSAKTTYHAARILAQAAGKLDSDKERRNREVIERRFYYQDRAVALIRRALLLLPEQQRGGFWKENIAEDSALWPIRHTYAFSQLEEQYSRPKGRSFLNASTSISTVSSSPK